MLMRVLWSRVLVLTCAATFLSVLPTRAMDAMDFSFIAQPAQAGNAELARVESDEDDDSFFSNGAKDPKTTAVVAATPLKLPAAAKPRPIVDVVATCRALLADHLNSDNDGFVHSCYHAVIQNGRR